MEKSMGAMQSIFDHNVVTQENAMPTLHFEPVVTGCPVKVPRKRKAKDLAAETAQLDAEQPTRRIIMRDVKSVAYWEDYDKETKGQVIGRFCHELHENVIDTFHSYFPATGMDQKIRHMAANAQNWYLGQPNAIQTAKGLPFSENDFIGFVNEHHTRLRQLDSEKLWKEVQEGGLPNYNLGNLTKPTAWAIFENIQLNEELRSHSKFIHDIAPVS